MPPEPEYLRGDLNDDGSVSADDAQIALLAYANSLTGLDSGLTEKQKRAGDINGDGAISIEDAQMILVYYVNRTISDQPVTWEELLGTRAAQPAPKSKKNSARKA